MRDIRIPPLSTLVDRRNAIREIVQRLDNKTLAELRRRAGEPVRPDTGEDRPLEEGAGQAVVDGYGVGRSDSGVATSEVARPTETRVTAAAGGRVDPETDEAITPDTWAEPADPIVDSVLELFAQLSEALGVLRAVDRRRQYVLNAGDALRGRQSTLQGDCQACGRAVLGTPDDRLRSGFCDACRKSWERWSKGEREAGREPDRLRFVNWRTAELARRAKEPDEGDEGVEWEEGRHIGAAQFEERRHA